MTVTIAVLLCVSAALIISCTLVYLFPRPDPALAIIKSACFYKGGE